MACLCFSIGEASPCCFYREADDVSCVVHGDDFTFESPPEALLEIAEALKKVWLVKVRAMLGPEPKGDKEVSMIVCDMEQIRATSRSSCARQGLKVVDDKTSWFHQ